MASETWALVALFPADDAVVAYEPPPADGACVECRAEIKALLRRLGRRLRPKLVVPREGEFKNQAEGYRAQTDKLTTGWTDVLATCSEARRFDTDLRAAMA